MDSINDVIPIRPVRPRPAPGGVWRQGEEEDVELEMALIAS